MGSGQFRLLLIGIILIQIGGFVVLWMKIPEATPAAPTQLAQPPLPVIDPATAIAAMKPPDEQLLRESIRTILKDELQTYLHQAREEKPRLAASGGGATVRPRPRVEASPQVAQQAHAIVDRALAAGVWNDIDNNALLKLAPQLSEAQRVELLEKIFGAINRQQLKATGSLPSL